MLTQNTKIKSGRIMLQSVKNIIVIASGKGGVGKSTIATNLAIALSRKGAKTALVDADVYGPSIPHMFNVSSEKMKVLNKEGVPTRTPVIKYNVKLLSIGFLMEKESAVLWRGTKAALNLIQLIKETEWGKIDYMIIDLPPDIGDIPMMIVQKLNITGAILITTPQSISLLEVMKAANMFRDNSVNVPILGVIENMSYLLSRETPQNKFYIFGKGAGDMLAKKLHVPLLGRIPISQEICESGESGIPSVQTNTESMSSICDSIANKVISHSPLYHEYYF